MGTEVVRPRDTLISSLTVSPRRNCVHDRPARRPAPRSVTRKRLSQRPAKSGNDPVMGRVTILRRGESVDSKAKPQGNDGEMIACGAERLILDPEQIWMIHPNSVSGPPPSPILNPGSYAGSACSMSPEPCSLPVPSFYKKKQALAATTDLRRLLLLD